MIGDNLKRLVQRKKCTLLGVGPMSVNCVDATIELAKEHDVPVLMIASRRQIDSDLFGGGYVNNWTTQAFANYVTSKNQKGQVLLARDHGGPWQNIMEVEQKLCLRRAMLSAKASYKADIDAGFQVLHIDPSLDIHGVPNVDEVLDRVYELYEFCWHEAQRSGKKVVFEVGTEEQSGSTNSEESLEYTLAAIKKFCVRNKIPAPTFVVVQCGTKVMEMRNVGCFESTLCVENDVLAPIQLQRMLAICNMYGVLMKEHNTDYLSNEALQMHPRLGIHAANVAPEFGVTESKALVTVLEANGLSDLSEQFLSISLESKKWEKWMLDGTKADAREKALIAGHYVFSAPAVVELKAKAANELLKIGINLELYLKDQLKLSIFRYMQHFRLIGTV